VQANYNTIVNVHIICSTQCNTLSGQVCKEVDESKTMPTALKAVWRPGAKAMASFEAEGLPALVEAANMLAIYDLGFT
jgi:hypothetical protein